MQDLIIQQGTFAPLTNTTEDNGALYIYDYATDNAGIPIRITLTGASAPTDFHPLGIEFDAPTSTLYVINHSRFSGSVLEIFHLDIATAIATHRQTFRHTLLHAPNAIHILGPGKLYITNDHFLRAAVSPFLSKVESFSGLPGGTVVYVDIATSSAKVVSRLPFANGVVALNTSTLVVASSTKPGLYFYTMNKDHSLTFSHYLRTSSGPDNLSLDKSTGRLMIAGHPFAPGLMQVSKGRPECDSEGEKKECGCWTGSWVASWSEEEGVKTLMLSGGEQGVCSSSTAVRDGGRGVGFVSMLYGKGIVVFKG